ncbi:MAG: hypothetical protein HY083_10730 [Gammaproteobacteria bacterium]|nr:hypothetical protein [Gammaproteobacteria bacterium]
MKTSFLSSLTLSLLLGLGHPVFAAETTGADALLAVYRDLRPKLEANVYGAPIYVASADEGERMHGEVYSVANHSYLQLVQALRSPRNWCDVALLHLNIKACTYEQQNVSEWLTFYSGRKFYEPPEKAYALRYGFRLEAVRDDYFRATLTAETGPFDSSDYRLEFEAVPLGDGSFVHLRYGYRQKLMTRLATGGYLATLGSGKVGFSVLDEKRDGKPVLVGGVRGIVERNAMRYYLAIQVFLESLDVPETQRIEQRFQRWFDLTERYPAQLHELEKADYLKYKHQELAQQLEHQRALDTLATP